MGFRLFKTTYKDRRGKKRQADKWYVEFRDHLDTVRRLPAFPSKAASEEMGGYMDRLLQPKLLRAVQQLRPIAEEAGLTLPQFALAWVLREPNVASAIIGASRPEQVRENAAASGATVDPALFARAETIVAEGLAA